MLDIAKRVGLYSIATIAGRLTGLLMTPVTTTYLTPADYGIMSLLDLAASMFSLLVSMKLGQSLSYHIANAKDEGERRAYMGSALAVSAGIVVVLCAVGLLAAPWIAPALLGVPSGALLLSLTVANLACNFPLDVGLSLMRALDRPRHFVAASLFRLFGTALATAVSLAVLGLGLKGLLASSLLVSILLALGVGAYVLRESHGQVRWHEARALLGYSAPLLLTTACMFTVNWLDRLFLRYTVSLEELGLYALAYRIGMVVAFAQNPIELYWSAQMFQVLKRADGSRTYVSFVSRVTLLLVGVAVLVTVFIRPLLRVIAGPEFQGAATYVPWVALAYVIRGLSSFIRSGLYTTAKTTREASLTARTALVCLAAYAVLIPPFGVAGALAATLLAFSVMLVLGHAEAQRVMPCPFEYGRLARTLLAGLLVGALSVANPAQSLVAQAASGCALVLLFLGLTLALGILTPYERQLLSGWVRRGLGQVPVGATRP